jgi:DNA helicase-2/ATP-dependent DNA helicase PcrA
MRERTMGGSGKKFWGCSDFPRCRGFRPFQEENNQQRGKLIQNPSPYQRDVFDWIQYGEGNAVVEAVAGSGKTCTMVHAASLFDKGAESVFLAFNKHIADELSSKVPAHVTCGTMHSLCLRSLRDFNPIKIDDSKCRNITKSLVDKVVPDSEVNARSEITRTLLRMVSLAKSTLVNPYIESEVLGLLAEYNLTFSIEEYQKTAIELLPQILEKSKEERTLIDFDDMIWHVYVHNLPIKQYQWVVCDEAQDLNNLQMEILKRMIAPGGRCICVGDRFQSIYGFRGANNQAIPLLIEKLNAKILPLNVCYRCPSRHIELAQKIVPQIESTETAKPGVIEHYSYSEVQNQLKDGDLILCRCNAPLVGLCFSLIERGIKATIKGRDIGQSLVTLIESMRAKDLPNLIEKITAYEEKETAKLNEKGWIMAAQSLSDRCNVILTISHRSEMHSIGDVSGFIDSLFQDYTKEGITCSSVHKAKGLEAESVYILYPNLMPLKYAKTDEDIQQERNIEYVALTRSKQFLGFITKDIQ